MNEERGGIAGCYREGMKNPLVALPAEAPGCGHVYHIFSVRCRERDALADHLAAQGIATNRHYPIPLHLQGAYASLGIPKGAFPLAEEISATQLSLPMYYGMTDEQVEAVIEGVNSFRG